MPLGGPASCAVGLDDDPGRRLLGKGLVGEVRCEGVVKGQNAKYPPNYMPDNGLGAKFEKSLRQVCKELGVHVEGKELMSTNRNFMIGESPKHSDEVSIMFWMEVLPFRSHTTSPKP